LVSGNKQNVLHLASPVLRSELTVINLLLLAARVNDR
jgi:hypothetical protein